MAIGTSLLTRAQSAELAGVTAETITKYEEIGLLVTVEHDGELMYREGDVRSLFYTREFSTPVSGAQFSSSSAAETTPVVDISLSGQPTAPEAQKSETTSDNVSEINQFSTTSGPTISAAVSEEAELRSLSEILQDLVSGSYQVGQGERSQSAGRSEGPRQAAPAQANALPENVGRENVGLENAGRAATSAVAGLQPQTSPSIDAATATPSSEQSQREIRAATTESKAFPQPTEQATHSTAAVAEFKAQAETISFENRSLREQVEMLREERNWLRKRVEQLEVRSEREQMLLLSENETVRRLVDNSKRKWSMPFRLPWFSDQN